MDEFGDYLARVDNAGRLHKGPEYGKRFTDEMLLETGDSGRVLVATLDDQIVAFAAGMLEESSTEDEMESIPFKSGRIAELYVSEGHRGAGIGIGLVDELEAFFQEHGCDTSRVEVFAPNEGAHDFYLELGYADRNIDMLKELAPGSN